MKLDRFRSFWRLAEGQRLRYAGATASLVVASCFLYLAPLVVQATIDGVIAPAEEREPTMLVDGVVGLLGGRESVARRLWWPAAVVLGLTAIAGIFTYLRGRLSASASESIVRRLRDRLYDHLQRLPCTWYDEAKTGDVIQRCTSDVETLRVFLANQVVEIGRAMIMLLIPIPLMLAIDPAMTLASVVLIPPIVAYSLIFFRKVRVAFKATDEAEGRLTTTIQENLTGIRVVRAFARQAHERDKMAGVNVGYRSADYRLYVLLARFWSLSDLMCFGQMAIVVGYGVYRMSLGTLPVGAFYYFLTAVTMFTFPVRMMGRILSDLGKAVVAHDRIREILDAPEESAPAAPRAPETDAGAIEFEGVSFGHGENAVLHDVSFRVEPGQTLALLGPSGCGKSTIVNLLLRLYDHEAGTIRLDGVEIREMNRQDVRGRMAVVMQEPFLYSRSLRENLTFARPSAEEEEMIEAATIACVHESIAAFDDGYETKVGERGVTLSGGQRQRVALARALLSEPSVMILDDAMSAVDHETEELILDALKRRRGRHTTLVIAHRISTLMHADRILVLEAGRVVQSGSHRELLAEAGLYRRLWDIQRSREGDETREKACTT